MDDARFLRKRLGRGPRALGAPFGHVWVQAESVGDVDWRVMRGVEAHVSTALAQAVAEEEEAARRAAGAFAAEDQI